MVNMYNYSCSYTRMTNKIDAQNFINPGNRFSTCAQIIGLKKKLGGLEGKILHHEITEI